MFHVLNARITFGNIFALDAPVEGVSTIDDGNKLSCVVDDSCFQPPASYTFMGTKMLTYLIICFIVENVITIIFSNHFGNK